MLCVEDKIENPSVTQVQQILSYSLGMQGRNSPCYFDNPQVMVEHVDVPSVIAGGIFLLIGETDVHQYKLTGAVMAQLFHLNLVYYNSLFPTSPVPLMSGL